MTLPVPNRSESLGPGAYAVGALSFIPLFGVLFGIIAIVLGAVEKKRGAKILIAMGLGGILFTVAIYGSLIYFGFVQRGGVFDGLRTDLAQNMINSVVPAIEFYKVQNGRYPDSLKTLQESLPKDSFVSTFDPTITKFGTSPAYRTTSSRSFRRGLRTRSVYSCVRRPGRNSR